MLQSKTFVKKTKKGTIQKVVREHYLRDDISCGSFACAAGCSQDTARLSSDPSLPLLMIDTNIALHQMDFLEHKCMQNVVVMGVVMEEVKKHNNSVYQRLKNLTQAGDRSFYTFSNEHHQDTYITANEGESPNDRNDRAIRTAALWYKAHLPQAKVVLLSNDADNRRKALEAGLEALSAREYAEQRSREFPELVDLVSSGREDGAGEGAEEGAAGPGKKKARLYPDHRAMSELVQGIKAGRLHQGTLRVNRYNCSEGWVASESIGQDILISGWVDMNRALDGDVVAVEVLPESQWKRESSRLRGPGPNEAGPPTATPATPELDHGALEEDDQEDGGAGAGVFDPDAPPEVGPGPGSMQNGRRPTGRVVGIITRNWRTRGYCGSLVPPKPGMRMHGTVSVLFQTIEPKFPRIRITTRQAESLMDQRIVVAIDNWPTDSRFPVGHYVRSLGKIGERDTETEVVLIEHDINTNPFSQAVYDCVPALPWSPSEADRADVHREDLRSKRIFSVDPPGCRDIDDALHVQQLPNGNIEVGVHIADVTHFVKAGTALDEEAALRATTTYLVNRRIDMLPKALTEEICSLKGGVERLAFSAIWEMTPEGEEVSVRFTKSLIKSVAAMTYAEAQSRIDDERLHDDVSNDLRLMNALGKKLRKRRMESGALELASPEVKFQIDTETHNPTDVAMYQVRDTNRMVEELMLLANIAVAREIERHFKACALLRRHPVPAEKMFEPLVKAAAAVGIAMDVSTSRRLAESLDRALRVDDPYFNKLIRIMATRCMTQAIYFSSGNHAEPEYHHYGLAARIYTHFTSPIRRYADVVVHRLLSAAIGLETLPDQFKDAEWTNRVVDNLNVRHKNARMAGRASTDLFTVIYFKDNPQVADARVVRVKTNGLLVFVPRYGIEGPVYLVDKERKGPQVILDEDSQTLRAADGTFRYQVFQTVYVRIQVEESHGGRRQLVLSLVSDQNAAQLAAESARLEDPAAVAALVQAGQQAQLDGGAVA